MIEEKPLEVTEIARSLCKKAREEGALIGEDLLTLVRELTYKNEQHFEENKQDLVYLCGYVSHDENGEEILDHTAFYEALLQAKGVLESPVEEED